MLADLLDLPREELLRDGEALAMAAASALLVAVVAWHGLGLVACATVQRWPHRRGWARVACCAPPLARRWAGVLSFTSVVLAPVGAHAQDPPPPPAPVVDEPFVRAPEPVAPVAPPEVPPAPAPPPAPAAAPAPAARTHVVVAGDNLWRIAAAEVAQRSGDPDPSDAAIVPYWRTVIDHNRATLRSGDPSLIYPGELVVLP